MRPTRSTVALVASLVTFLGIPAVAAAEAPTDLYVNNREGANCSDNGTGAQATPFCTISAAAKAVKAGQTVRIVAAGDDVTIDRSGEPGKPITFAGENSAYVDSSWTISGASHVVVRGIKSYGRIGVARSAHVELDQIESHDDLVIGKASADVHVSRSRISGILIEGGAQRTVLSRNHISESFRSPAVVTDATGTVITNNTVFSGCEAAVSVRGASTGSSVFNNVLVVSDGKSLCRWPTEPHGGLSVAQGAVAGTRADYNVVTGQSGVTMTPYTWSGTGYPTPAAFLAATGQGAHDLLPPWTDDFIVSEGSPVVDSADATAPGVLLTDHDGNPVVDDPLVPNTGKDGGYLDRGAFEFQDRLTSVSMRLDQTWAPVGTKVTATALADSHWPSAVLYSVDFGDGSMPVLTRQGDAPEASASHVYASPCTCEVKVTAVNQAGMKASASWSTKVSAADPLTAAFTAEPVLPTSDNPITHIAPLTLQVDTSPTKAPWLVPDVRVDFGDGAAEQHDRLDAFKHTYSAPGEYKVTVEVYDEKGAQSTSVRRVKVGYAASGYVAVAPFRLLDTRTTSTPLSGGSSRAVQLPAGISVPGHPLSGSMAAAVLNVTVTGAREDTHLTVWPEGQSRPTTSNVNVQAGGTSSNTVSVPVGADGKLLAQLNSGSASLVVDFVGYYQPNIGQRFTPLTPTRVADTRADGGALGGGQTRTVKVAGVNGIPADATAVAFNLTGTGASETAHVIAYPDPAKRPTTSNLNVEPGKDKSNQAIVPVGPNGTIALFTNSGSTHLVLDAVGYYGKDGTSLFTPTVPRRLADTRSTGKLAPGTSTTVPGLPAEAVGAVLNVTATNSAALGFLTVHGYGAPRPEASSVNTRPGATVPNHVTTPVGDGGRVSIWNSYGGSTDVITDLLGYFAKG
ncbi:PKD domain-containing protein [Streptomyces sp. NPDC049949]|uniref:right-handed parallel beta-helix repeat-containing protein n=1 Tax=Streptomyces sp. NPDC049949 TaxID=3154627 RepID=UPI00341596E2